MVSDRFNLRNHSFVFVLCIYSIISCVFLCVCFLGRYNHGLRNCEVSVLAICLLSHILEYIMVNVALCVTKSAACIDQDCFYQLPCVIYT